jgi:REP element-mobilizing transposase RayT
MRNNETLLAPNGIYHIYNHANGMESLFKTRENYIFFLNRYGQFINPVAETLAYCLMPNHIHFVVKIKDQYEIQKANDVFRISREEEPEQLSDKNTQLYISQVFGNLFSSYGQAFNKQQGRKGSLFIPNFRRKWVDSNGYLANLIPYIHSNPVHHGFTKNVLDWEFSSIHAYWLEKKTHIARSKVLELYEGKEGFIERHQTPIDLNDEFEI